MNFNHVLIDNTDPFVTMYEGVSVKVMLSSRSSKAAIIHFGETDIRYLEFNLQVQDDEHYEEYIRPEFVIDHTHCVPVPLLVEMLDNHILYAPRSVGSLRSKRITVTGPDFLRRYCCDDESVIATLEYIRRRKIESLNTFVNLSNKIVDTLSQEKRSFNLSR